VLAISSGLCCGLGVPYDLTCKFGAKGVVTINGKVDGNTASGKAQTLLVDVREDGGYDARVVIYVANAKLEGGAFCEAVDVVLSDTDGDGKLDHAGQP